MKTPLTASVTALLAALLLTTPSCTLDSHDDSFAADGAAASVVADSPDVLLPGPPRVGETYDFALPLADGGVVSSEALRGKVVVLDFWATWCGPCREEIPHLRDVYQRHHDEGLEIVGLSFDRRYEDLARFTGEVDLPWTQVYLGELQRAVGERTGVTSIPRFFVLDRNGRLVTTQGVGRLDALLPKLLAETRGA